MDLSFAVVCGLPLPSLSQFVIVQCRLAVQIVVSGADGERRWVAGVLGAIVETCLHDLFLLKKVQKQFLFRTFHRWQADLRITGGLFKFDLLTTFVSFWGMYHHSVSAFSSHVPHVLMTNTSVEVKVFKNLNKKVRRIEVRENLQKHFA